MTEEELKNKCKERAKIFQQAMESCKSSSPMDCIEWFADRIAELEKENAELKNEISLKDEEIGCVETDFNTFKSKAKEKIRDLLEIIKRPYQFTAPKKIQMVKEAEQFLNSDIKEG